MRNLLCGVFTLITLAVGVIPVSGQYNRFMSDEELRLSLADRNWLKVFAAKDLEKSVAFCADDGSVLAPNAPIATGKKAIGQLFSAFFALPGFGISWTDTKTEVAKSGELGYTSGTYQFTFNDPSGKAIVDKGKYVTVWKKQKDGGWKVMLD